MCNMPSSTYFRLGNLWLIQTLIANYCLAIPLFRQTVPAKTMTHDQLNSLGYLPKVSVFLDSEAVFLDSIKRFHNFGSLPATGKLDDVTIEKMKQPRCYMPDSDMERQVVESRRKRYTVEGMVWEEHSLLRFKQTEFYLANIDIAFVKRNHGDGEPFDGQGGILAHAFFPQYGGDIHFDDDEKWSLGPTKGLDLYAVAAHEIGHALGLKHSKNSQALMAPFYQSYSDDGIHLHQDDIDALHHLYGSPEESSFSQSSMETNSISDEHSFGEQHPDPLHEIVDMCRSPRLDAITVIGNGSTYAFQGKWYWRLNKISYDDGYPRLIAEDWDGLPDNLQAAVTDRSGITYFFKGDDYWLYDANGTRLSGGPKKVSNDFFDMPSNIDAAMIWSYDRGTYFFKGKFFWKYEHSKTRNIMPRLIKSLSPRLTGKVDAAFTWTNGKTYIFVGSLYYRISSWRVLKVMPGYPRSIGEWWFGCTPIENLRQSKDTAEYESFLVHK